ncbi:hypothetical protein [Burkholderia sp. 3C]
MLAEIDSRVGFLKAFHCESASIHDYVDYLRRWVWCAANQTEFALRRIVLATHDLHMYR